MPSSAPIHTAVIPISQGSSLKIVFFVLFCFFVFCVFAFFPSRKPHKMRVLLLASRAQGDSALRLGRRLGGCRELGLQRTGRRLP